jgi:hypothetical protein
MVSELASCQTRPSQLLPTLSLGFDRSWLGGLVGSFSYVTSGVGRSLPGTSGLFHLQDMGFNFDSFIR